jgi:hypothetical protein
MSTPANSAIFTQTVMTAQATCTAAKTTYGDNTNAVLLLTAGANGGVLYGLKGIAKGSTGAAGRLDVFTSLNGTTLTFLNSVNFASYSQSTSAAPVQNDIGYSESAPRRLAPLEQIWVSTSIAPTAGYAVDAQYENL